MDCFCSYFRLSLPFQTKKKPGLRSSYLSLLTILELLRKDKTVKKLKVIVHKKGAYLPPYRAAKVLHCGAW